MAKKEIKEEVATVSVNLGATINVQEWEYLKVQIGLSYPCKANKTAVNQTMKEVFTRVKKEMDKRIKELTGGRRG